MTSTDDRLSTDPFLTATADEVEQGIRRELLKHGFTSDGPDLIDPDLIDAVMTVTGPVLEAKDKAIAALLVALEAAVRASERRECVQELDSHGFPDAAGALTARAAGLAVWDAGNRP